MKMHLQFPKERLHFRLKKKQLVGKRTVDRILTSPYLGFPIMFLILGVVFWLTIEGANVPSGLIASFLLDTIHPVLKSLLQIQLDYHCG